MRKLIYIFAFVLAASSVLFSSCRDEDSTVGKKWFDSKFNNIQTDTCTVLLSTALSDSLATSSDTVCQIGHYKDATRGDITTSFYTEYNLASNAVNNDNRYRFDSITVRLWASGDYVGDTLAGPQQIAVHKLTQNVEMDDKGYLYNKSSVNYQPTPITTINFTPHPGQRKKDIEVRLPDALGQEWFDMMRNDELHFRQQTYFRDYFKGFAFLPTSSGMLNGFQVNDSSFVVAMYYHDITNQPIAKKMVFTPNKTQSFNKVNFDRTGTPLATMKPGINNAISTSLTGNIAHLQGLTGLYIMIDFPYLNDLMASGQMVSIESAALQLYPVKSSYGDSQPLPSKLQLYTADSNGSTEDVVYNAAGTSVQTGSLVTDYNTYLNTYYTFDITSFLQGIFGKIGTNKKKLKLMLPTAQFFSTCQGALFGDRNFANENNKVKLTILYKTYNDKQ
ncbi:MAG: DUF4270 domain-containing protein [Bacteroidales bacterium]|nr:DUF4270 domain-containing protein [Bacteroidales bacterium]